MLCVTQFQDGSIAKFFNRYPRSIKPGIYKITRAELEKAGFRYCGIIYLLNGEPRLAFQKI